MTNSSDVMKGFMREASDYHDTVVSQFIKEKKALSNQVSELKSEKEILKNVISGLEKELRNEKIFNTELRDKLKLERERVKGWKHRALKNDVHKQSNHFIFDEKNTTKPKADLYAPMTEQFPDEKNVSLPNNVISIGETEKFHSDNESSSFSSDEECIKSPSVLPVPNKVKTELSKFCQPKPMFNKNSRFETSDDLFTESVPKKNNIKAGYFHSVNEPQKSSFCSSSTPNTHVGNFNDSKKKLTLKTEPSIGQVESKGYKYTEVVRGKAEREKLNGYTCNECEQFYANEKLTDGQRKKILDRCSRHRHKTTPPPSTPDEFWEVGFPPTQEYIKKGLLEVNDQSTPREKLISEKRRKRIKYI